MSKSNNYDKTDLKDYQHLIRKLIYLLYSTKSNITFAIGQLSKHNVDLRIGYMKVVNRVVQYLKDILYLGLVYKSQLKDEGETKVPISPLLFGLIGYGDNSYTRDSKNRKSVMEYCYFINEVIVSWYSKK